MRDYRYSLAQLLALREKTDLYILAQRYKFRGYSAYSKEELVELLGESIKNECIQYLAAFSERDMQLFKELSSEISLAQGRLGRAAVFISLGWASRIEKETETYFVIAAEIREIYEKVQEEDAFKELHLQRQHIRVYRNGLVNLYGAVELYWLEYLYNRDYNQKISFAILLNDFKYINQLYGGCKLIGDYLVHASLYEDGEAEFKKLKQEVYQKDYYEPSKLLITLMSKEESYEQIETINKLKAYLKNHILNHDEFVAEALLTLVIRTRMESRTGLDLMEMIMGEWYQLGINIQDMNRLQEVTLMMAQIIKATRTWYNKGYTAEELQHEIFPNLYTKENSKVGKVKVGRNDLCPCGSGKKYKKCCI